MKSKAEIIDALERCRSRDMEKCFGCKYKAEGNECWHWLFTDLLALLNKSDFEVVEEVLTRSKKQDWLGTGFCGEGYELERLDSIETPPIIFDGEGNIL